MFVLNSTDLKIPGLNFHDKEQLVTGNATFINQTFMIYIDYIIRVIAVLIHCLYFGLVICFKTLQKRQGMYLHHVNLISLLYCLHYCAWIGNFWVDLGNSTLDHVFCYMSEIFWIFLKFARNYSLSLLAAYRLLYIFYHFYTNPFLYYSQKETRYHIEFSDWLKIPSKSLSQNIKLYRICLSYNRQIIPGKTTSYSGLLYEI